MKIIDNYEDTNFNDKGKIRELVINYLTKYQMKKWIH